MKGTGEDLDLVKVVGYVLEEGCPRSRVKDLVLEDSEEDSEEVWA